MNEFKKCLRRHPMRPIMNRTIVFSLLLILIFAWPVWGATYYVKSGGNDSLDGRSDANAWSTIAKVQATVTSGDTVYFRSQDTWSSASSPVLQATAGVTYIGNVYGSGTGAKIQTTGTQTKGVVRLDVSNVNFYGFNVDMNSQNSGGIWIGPSSVSIQNINVDNCIVHGSAVNDFAYGIYVGGFGTNLDVANVTITNTTVHDVQHEGIAIYPRWGSGYSNSATNVIVRNCTVYNTGQGDPTPGHYYTAGIMVVNKIVGATIEYNTVYNNNGVGILLGTSGSYYVGDPTGVAIRYNAVYNNSEGIALSTSQTYLTAASMDIYGNIVHSNTAKGISVGGPIGTSTVNIYNNTVYQSGSTTAFGAIAVTGTGTPIHLKNNIFYGAAYYLIQFWSVGGVKGDSEKYVDHSNNLLYRAGSSSDWILNEDYTKYNQAQVTSIWDATSKTTNPSFTGGTLPTGFTGTYGTNMVPNTNYFAITSGDALNNGATLGSPYNGCINGAGLATPITRPQGAAYDIGAYEYQGIGTNTLLYAGFPGYGLYKWNGSAWSQLNSVVATGMAASGSTLYANFPGLGFYKWDGSAWSQLKSVVATGMTASGSDLYANFAGYGLYKWNGSAWSQLNSVVAANNMVASGSDLYANFAGYGLYKWNGSAWSQLNPVVATSMAASGSVLYANFAGYGLYKWNGSAWSQLNPVVATGMTASGSALYANFTGYGLYKWNGSAWSQLNSVVAADNMVASGSDLYANFAGYGLYKWNGSAWSQLNSVVAADMVAN